MPLSLSAIPLMKERGRGDFPSLRLIEVLCGGNHPLLDKPCIVVHQVDDVSVVLRVLVLKSVALHHLHLFERELHCLYPLLGYSC